MESQERSGNVTRWENMDKDILSSIFKKLNIVDVTMKASSRVCKTWFLASHNKTIWNTINLNGVDSIDWDNPYEPDMHDTGREKHQYQLRKILIEINKFSRTVPINLFFKRYYKLLEEDLAIISERMPNIRKLALPVNGTLNLNSVQSAFSHWENLQTLIFIQFKRSDDALSLELQAIRDNCRNITNIKFFRWLNKDLVTNILCYLPILKRLSFRCSYVKREAAISLIIGLPNLKILNLSHCVFTQLHRDRVRDVIIGIKPDEELIKIGTQKLEKLMVCCLNCPICQDVWKHTTGHWRDTPERQDFWEKQWRTDEIKEFEF